MKEIKLSKGRVVLVSDEDYDWLNQWKWWAYKGSHSYYARRFYYIPGKKGKVRKAIIMHRLILGLTDPTILCDHADHNGLNNQRNNIRIATRSQNRANSRPNKNGTSKYLGVSRQQRIDRHNKVHTKWAAQIGINGKTIGLGRFKAEIEAAKAYDIAAKIHHKEFANLNFKQDGEKINNKTI